MFILDLKLSNVGTSRVAEVEIAPAFLVARFGSPLDGDGYRVTGQYYFKTLDGDLFTVYDYKATAAYLGDEEDALWPEQFWSCYESQELSVGGRGDYGDGSAKEFIDWLLAEQHNWWSASE